MCKCFQSCLETFYWHCFEKHCCYDESIALYSEDDVPKITTNGTTLQSNQNGSAAHEKQSEKNNNSHHFDHMSFYDSVAIIAHRAIFTIEPLKKNKNIEQLAIDNDIIQTDEKDENIILPIVEQPKLTHNSDIIKKSASGNISTSKISLEAESVHSCTDTREVNAQTNNEFNIPTITEDLLPKSSEISLNNSTDSIDALCFNLIGLGANFDIAKSVPCNLNANMLSVQDEEAKQLKNKHRKQSLHERRVSRSIHLELLKDHKTEVPIIRQNSIPKFYLDTPTVNQIDSALIRSPSMALSSPVAPNNEFIFDLKSIVQMERERSHNSVYKPEGEPRRSKEFSTLSTHLGNKLKIIKRHASAVNLQNRSN